MRSQHYTAVCFYFRFTGTAQTDTSPLAFKVCPHARKAGQKVLVLCQFYLRACIGRLGAPGKDVEYEVRTVQYFYLEFTLDIAQLA